jgi:ABC-type glycerol-3-phosphate transport system permease component
VKQISINPKKFEKNQIGFHLVLLPIAIFMILPIIYIVSDAFKPQNELFVFPPTFITLHPTLENFRLMLSLAAESGIPLSRYLLNSVSTSMIVVVLTVLLSSSTAFAISKLTFKGKSLYFKINTYALMFVPVAVTIPRYLILVKMGAYDTYWAYILPMIAMPVGLFLIKQFMDQIPNELIEAARVDGASNWQIYFYHMLPLTKSALVTIAFLAFQSSWMSTEASNIFIDNEALKSLAFYLNTLSQNSGNIVAARGVSAVRWLIMFAPNFLVFVFLQSRVMESMAQSGIK